MIVIRSAQLWLEYIAGFEDDSSLNIRRARSENFKVCFPP